MGYKDRTGPSPLQEPQGSGQCLAWGSMEAKRINQGVDHIEVMRTQDSWKKK
jgi:hypothetical protein